jgi:hypothetical protein
MIAAAGDTFRKNFRLNYSLQRGWFCPDFNSLDAQRDAAQAYIRSQAHAGRTL